MFGPNGRFLHGAFHRCFREELLAFLGRYGVETKVERGGRIFPVSDDAADVVNALRRYLADHGVDLRTGVRVTGIAVRDGRVEGVRTENGNAPRPRRDPRDRRRHLAGDRFHRRRLPDGGGARPHRHETPPGPGAARRRGGRTGKIDAGGEPPERPADRLPPAGGADRSRPDPGEGYRPGDRREKAARSGHREPDGGDALHPFRDRRADHAPDEPFRRGCPGGGAGQRLDRSEARPHGGRAPGPPPARLRPVRQAGFPEPPRRASSPQDDRTLCRDDRHPPGAAGSSDQRR